MFPFSFSFFLFFFFFFLLSFSLSLSSTGKLQNAASDRGNSIHTLGVTINTILNVTKLEQDGPMPAMCCADTEQKVVSALGRSFNQP